MSLSFAAPAWFLLLPVWAALTWLATRLRLPLSYTGPGVRWGFLRAYAPTLGFAGVLTLSTLALSRPTLVWQRECPYLPPTWVLLDLSYSMDETDLLPSRRKFALSLLNACLDSLNAHKAQGSLGLIGFAAQAYPILPPTEDREAYRFALREAGRLRLGEGTDLAAALTVLRAVAQPGQQAWLLSDGAHNIPFSPHLEEVAILLQRQGIQVHTVLIGQQGPQVYPEALARISRITQGHFFVGNLSLTSVLEKRVVPMQHALEGYLVLGALGLGLITLGAMAVGGWFSILSP